MPFEEYKKIAVAGGTGTLGSVVVKELIKSGLFNITVLTRETSTHTFPPEVKVAKVNYDSIDSITEVLKGQDALVSTLGTLAVGNQKQLIDAAVKAGVKRIIPSEFGCDLHNEKTRALPVYAGKVEIEKYLDDLAVKGFTSYTLIFTGPFLDGGLRNGLFFNFKERKAEIFDGGERLISASRLSTIGKAIRRVLTHPRETADRAVWVKDIDVSQKQLLELAQALTPGEEWDIKETNTAELAKTSLEQVQKGEIGPLTFFNLVRVAIFGEGYGSKFEHVHNSVLGIAGITLPDIEELVVSIFSAK
ncbi:hypothetical protein G7Y89_g7262 [Cudoniella acicularis]|uniref:NmrA-like domain-containing protein n=1 Tax=Cudoniella acicularis TaxID=354080 RepID=A0A8H4W4Q8_9HELO|nr:hypothetical protein G7Y89_g7262 [Cudoniella acicularis]